MATYVGTQCEMYRILEK